MHYIDFSTRGHYFGVANRPYCPLPDALLSLGQFIKPGHLNFKIQDNCSVSFKKKKRVKTSTPTVRPESGIRF